MIFLVTLPFPLWDVCRWLMLPAVFLISLALLGIEDIGERAGACEGAGDHGRPDARWSRTRADVCLAASPPRANPSREGVQIEEPFSVMDLDSLCNAAARNVRDIASYEGTLQELVASAKGSQDRIPDPELDAAVSNAYRT